MRLLTTVIASLLTGVFARSSVHMVSNNGFELETKPEVSLNTFSMLYSHMMDSSVQHPAFQLQDNNQVQEIASILPTSSSLFEKKIDGHLMVIVAGVDQPQDVFSQYDTSFYVMNDDAFRYAALVEDVVENDQDISIYKNQKVNNNGQELFLDENELIENFNTHFMNYKIELFDIERNVDKKFVIEMEMIRELSQLENIHVGMIEINTLKMLGDVYGIDSKEYKEAQMIVKDLLETLVIPTFQKAHARGVSTVVITPYEVMTAEAIEGDACFKSAKACAKGTSDCSGRGQCTLIQENCYACQCQSSSFGESCQYVNAVSDFQLLFWTSVLLIVATTSIIICVFQSGSNTDAGVILTHSVPKQE